MSRRSSRRPRRTALLVLALALGCRPTPPTPRVARAPVAPPAPARVFARTWNGWLPRLLDGAAGASGRDFIVDTLRARREGDVVTVAEDETAASLLQGVELGARWVFTTSEGEVLASEGWLGALQPVGRVRVGARLSTRSRGRAVLVAEGRAWTTDGHSLVALPEALAPVVEGAFVDARRGALLHHDGGLSQTLDGGATWRAVSVGDGRALRVFADGAELRVETTDGAWALTARGTLDARVVTDRAARRDEEARREALTREVVEAWTTAGPVLGRDAVALGGGAAVTMRDGTARLREAGGTGRVRAVLGGACDLLQPWGDGAFLRCGRWLRVAADGEVAEVVPPAGVRVAPPRLVLSHDGVHAAFAGPCASGGVREGEEAREQVVCLLDDGRGRWREVALPSSLRAGQRTWLYAMHGATMLVQRGEGISRFDARTGATQDLALPEGIDPTLVFPRDVTRDGIVLALAHVCDGTPCVGMRSVLLRAPPGAPFEVVPLPASASAFSFADAQRGLVVGATLGATWRTTDGGRGWERVPLDEALREVRVDAPIELRCDALGCRLGDLLEVRGWGPMQRTPGRVVRVEGETLAPRGDRLPDWEPALPRHRCRVLSGPTPSPGRDPSARRALTRDGVWRFTATSDQRTTARLWRDGAPLTVTLPFAAPTDDDEADAFAVAAGSMLLRDDDGWRVWGPGFDAPALAPFPAPGVLEVGAFEVTSAIVGGSHGLLARFGVREVRVDVTAALDARGATVGRRVDVQFIGRVPVREWRVTALARRGGRWGRAALSQVEASRFEGLDGVREALPAWDGALRACARAPGADDTTLWSEEWDVARSFTNPVWRQVAEVELGPSGACLRSVRAKATAAFGPRPDDDAVWHLEAAPGGFRGFVDTGVTRRAVVCAPAPAPAPGTQ